MKWFAAITDIDTLKQAEREIRQREQELRRSEVCVEAAQRLTRTGSFGWDVSSGEIYWSGEMFRIFEFDQATEFTIELILQRTHPEDRALVRQVIDRASAEGGDFDFEHRLPWHYRETLARLATPAAS